MTRTTYHHGNLRQGLLEAALQIVRADGPDAVSLRELARQLEVSPAAIYRHFADRDAVLAEVARHCRADLASHMLVAVQRVRRRDQRSRAIERFLAVGRAYLAFAREEPNLLTAAFLPLGIDVDESDDPSPWAVLVTALDDLVLAGAMPPERRPGAEVIAWSSVHGFAILGASHAFRSTREAAPDEDVLLEGITRSLGIDRSADG
jgi:AcrR family transcriptional regulator